MALAHFNHKLRKSADEDELFVRNLAEELGLKVFSGRADVRDFARKKQLNLEEAARLKRYEFLRKAAGKFGADYILTAHTMTDQAETVLMKIFRGTGLEGLQGIRLKAGNIVRPLLCLDRQELEDYLRENHFGFRQDETNEDERFLRNKIRLKLIPLLEKEFDPAITAHLTEAALIAQGENEALSQMVEKIWPKVTHGGSLHLELNLRELEKNAGGPGEEIGQEIFENCDWTGITNLSPDASCADTSRWSEIQLGTKQSSGERGRLAQKS